MSCHGIIRRCGKEKKQQRDSRSILVPVADRCGFRLHSAPMRRVGDRAGFCDMRLRQFIMLSHLFCRPSRRFQGGERGSGMVVGIGLPGRWNGGGGKDAGERAGEGAKQNSLDA